MKENHLRPDRLVTLATEFAKDFCKQNQILSFSTDSGSGWLPGEASCICTMADVAPTGNTAPIFKRVAIIFEVFNSGSSIFSARVRYAYDHPTGGGSYMLPLVIVTRPTLDLRRPESSPPDYVGFSTRGVLSAYANHTHDERKKHEKKIETGDTADIHGG